MTPSSQTLLDVKGLKKYFPVRRGVFQKISGYVKAVDDVNLFVRQGETLGLVGESGCGKTTAGRSILNLTKPTAGQVMFRSRSLSGNGDMVNLGAISRQELKDLRQEMQIIFQDPYSSLDPRMTVAQIIGEPLAAHGLGDKSEREDRIRDLLVQVGLKPDHIRRYPHEFSGGQRQRIGIARALAPGPQLIVADEPVSALDVSIQAQVTNLMLDLQDQYNLTYLFIGHDLSVVKYISDRVAVMYLGKVVELVNAGELFNNPKHPYSEALMSAVPAPDPDLVMDRIILEGDVPSPVNPPSGCYFHPRCRYAKEICRNEAPEYRHLGNDHYVTCHRAEEITLRSLSHHLKN